MDLTNYVALSIVVILVAISILVAIYSRRYTRTAAEFYVAGRKISWLQNALALTGDYLSAASFLGVAGAIAVVGIDKAWDGLGYFGGYIVLLLLLAVPLRKIGKFTAPEALTTRFTNNRSVRFSAMISVVLISTFYVIPQFVGAGALLQLLLGWDYLFSLIVIGIIVISYVVIGGMRATTYNQIIQGLILWVAMALILIMTLSQFFNWNLSGILDSAGSVVPPQLASELLHDSSVPDFSTLTVAEAVAFVAEALTGEPTGLTPGIFATGWMNTLALAIGLVFGTAGLPHVLTRYFTVEKPKDARTSTLGVLVMIGTFYMMATFVGLAAMYLLYPDMMNYFLTGQASIAQNMAVPLLGEMVGGNVMLGIAIGGAFCAILSTVAGLLITVGTSVTHDFYKEVINPDADERRQVTVAKITIVVAGAIAVLLGIGLADQNVSYLVTLAFGIAASVFFPVLFLSVWWTRYTSQGALATMITGIVVSAVFVIATLMGVSDILGVPVLVNPALYSLPAALMMGVIVSLLTDDVGDVENFMAMAHGSEADEAEE
ncbi:MAG: cation/acetate symporter [Candidatus Methanomethylophilaceae archaeon]|nr:cation/acetate symporter [Candidatus Methanomethylophilaceae archaeon]MDI3541094.1 cation/acetate symporter [Candidatus Methanomethylophilaceae archaeon]HIJ00889.1 cation acetate symporter [Candidatus Methanomethylophilaceae archaeon]